MKVIAILLSLVNTLVAALILLSCISTSESLGWLGTKVAAGILVIIIGVVTFRDGMRFIHPGKMLLAGLFLVILGSASVMWGIHLSILSGDMKNVMIFYGSSLLTQGVASVIGLAEETGVTEA